MKKIDMHTHLGQWWFPIPNSGTAESLLRLCDRYDIRRIVASSTQAIAYDMRAGNAEMAEAAEKHERILAYCYCNPKFLEESCEEMDTYLPLDNFVGVKVHASYSACGTGHPRMYDLIAEIAKRTSLVKIHNGGAEVGRHLAAHAEAHPGLNIIIAHALGADFKTAANVAADHSNLYLDFCSSWSYRGKVEYAVDKCGAGQIVFGTDMDLLDPAFTLGMFEGADISDEQRQAIYYDNAARLLGLSG